MKQFILSMFILTSINLYANQDSSLEKRLNRDYYTGLAIYSVTIITDLALGDGVDDMMLIPGIGPILASSEDDNEDYKGILIVSGLLQSYYIFDYFRTAKKINESNNFSYNLIPYKNNPTLRLSLTF